MKSLLLTYLLWLIGGFFGLHKFYLGRPLMGLLYFCTFGGFVLGWVIDFFTLPRQVRIANLLSRQPATDDVRTELRQEFAMLKRGLLDLLDALPMARQPGWREALKKLLAPGSPNDDLMLALLRAAQQHNGRLSVTDGVLATGAPFPAVEGALKSMVESGYVYVDNDSRTGIVVYIFKEIL